MMKKKFRVILPLILLLVVLFLTIGYSTFIAEFSVTNIVAKFREESIVRVTGVTTQSGVVSNLDYSSGAVVNDVALSSGASITYNVTVTNLGNVPMAVSDVTFTDRNGAVTGLTSNINEQNYEKICDNNVCTGGVSKNISVAITNNNSTNISGYLGVNLKFSKVYTVTYGSNQPEEVLEGRTYTYTIPSNRPSTVIISGTHGSYTYQNGVLTINDVGSNLIVYPAYNIIYNGEQFDKVKAGENYTHTFTTEIPKTIAVSGTCASSSYTNHTISLTNVQGDITLTPTFGKIEITNIQYISSENVERHDTPDFDGMTAEFNIKFKKDENATSDDFTITYEVSLFNDYVKDYIFRGFDFNPIIHSAATSDTAILHLDLDGVANGDIIPAGTTKTFRIVLWLETSNPDGSYTVDVGSDANVTETLEEEVGSLTATVTPVSGDLTGNNDHVAISVQVTNNYPSEKTFTMQLSNSNLKLEDQNNQSLTSFTVSGSSTQTFTVYVSKQSSSVAFLDTSTTTDLIISPNGLANVTAGTLTFTVDKFEGVDNEMVVVSGASITMHRSNASAAPTVGRINASWHRDDEGGTPVQDYVVTLYDSAGSTAATVHTNSGTTSCSFTGLADGNYYIVVYGIDANTSGASFVSTASQTPGYATKSATVNFDWRYDVDLSGMNYFTITQGDVSTVNAETAYTLRFSALSNYRVPTDLTVQMGGRTLTRNTDYTYTTTSSSTNATLQISKVTGNLVISGTPVSSSSSGSASSGGGSCLIAGTQVMLANGSTKNIEDLQYNDLLMVVDHLTGELSQAYPVWIEKENTADSYLKITFDDGTILKSATGGHSVFDADLLRYKDVADDDFGIGNRVYKLDPETNKFKIITVTGKEIVKEDVTYHNVISVGYYNFIAENLLTQESFANATNLYGFKKNLKYSYGYYLVRLLPKLPYSYFVGTVPHHIFIGSKLENAYTMIGPNFDEDFLRNFAYNEIKEPYKINDNNAWMMTTSLDNLDDDYHKYLYEEGSIYTLPNNKEVKCFFNTFNDKCYKPGSKVKVETSFHFIAKY